MALKMSAAALYRISRLPPSLPLAAAAARRLPQDSRRPRLSFCLFVVVVLVVVFDGTRTNINAKSKGKLKKLMWAATLPSLPSSLFLPVPRSIAYLLLSAPLSASLLLSLSLCLSLLPSFSLLSSASCTESCTYLRVLGPIALSDCGCCCSSASMADV